MIGCLRRSFPICAPRHAYRSDELHTLLKSEIDKWGAVIEAAEIKAQ
jgi:hypothetical protein